MPRQSSLPNALNQVPGGQRKERNHVCLSADSTISLCSQARA